MTRSWAFTYAKQKNFGLAKSAPEGVGEAWTWTALDADTKLIVSWLVEPREAGSAYTFIHDLSERLRNRVQLTADGLGVYVNAVEDVFGAEVDFGQLVEVYSTPGEAEQRRYSPPQCKAAHRVLVTGEPNEGVHLYQLRRAAEPQHADEPASVHAAHQRLLEEADEPRLRRVPLLPVAQLLPAPRDAEDDSSAGGRTC